MVTESVSYAENSDLPPIPEKLLRALEARYPLRSPGLDWEDRRIWVEVGQRRVVEMLRREFEEQRNRF